MNYPQTVSVTLLAGTVAVGTAQSVVLKVPTDALGGGITVVEAGVCSRRAIAAGSIPMFNLVYGGTDSAVDGTIAASSTAAFTAGTIKSMTVTPTFVDASYYVGWEVMGTAVSASEEYITGWFSYLPGR